MQALKRRPLRFQRPATGKAKLYLNQIDLLNSLARKIHTFTFHFVQVQPPYIHQDKELLR